jgi:serine/threonine protein kinase
MGEVYRARDTRLDRTVAIKILPSIFANDARLKTRFEREAKTISALSHPHICSVFDVGDSYIVMEYCEGKTLAKRIAEGSLPLEQVLRYGIDIADALDKAHRQGIIHRDLKPSNIILTKSGVKLLDFGLAKQYAGVLTDRDSSVSIREEPLTEEGKILGTIQYMAPELFVGREADPRSDIFALGLVLYEMLTGKPAFKGTSKAGLIAAILEHEPVPMSQRQPSTPPALERLVRSCLAKDPDERIQSTHDVALQLTWIAEGALPQRTVARRNVVVWGVAGIAAISTVAALALWKFQPVEPSTSGLRRFSISIPSTTPLWVSAAGMMAISPDGTHLVYSSRKDGVIKLYLSSLETSESRAIPGTEKGSNPFFSPDGRWVGFCTSDGELKKVSLSGGSPLTISKRRSVQGATWGSNDTIVFAERRMPLQRLSAGGGVPQPLTTPDPSIEVRWPVFLPGGNHVLCTVGDRHGDFENAKLEVLDLRSGKFKVVLEGAMGGQYVRTGHLVYAHSRSLFAVPFDLTKMEVTGSPTPIVDDLIGTFASGVAHFAVSSDGSIFYVPYSGSNEAELVWADRDGKITSLSPLRQVYEEPVRLSPDGKQLIVPAGAFPRMDLWRYEIDRDSWTRMTSEATNFAPVWSPDAKQIVFTSNRNGALSLYLMSSDESTSAKPLAPGTNTRIASSWSPDGQTIAFVEKSPTTKADILLVSLVNQSVKPFATTGSDESEPVFSPDGRWIAFESNEFGRREIYVQAYPSGGRKWRISNDGGQVPRWRADGRELFYFKDHTVFAVDMKLAPELVPGRPRILFQSGPGVTPALDVTPDGQRFVMLRGEEGPPLDRIGVVLGLFGTLNRTPGIAKSD